MTVHVGDVCLEDLLALISTLEPFAILQHSIYDRNVGFHTT